MPRRRVAHALRALGEAEAMWRSIAESSADQVVILAPDGTILFINRTVSDLTADDVTGTSAYDYLSPEDSRLVKERRERVLRTGEPGQYQVQYEAPDGTVLYFESRVRPILRAGQVVALAVSATNVTERKQMEEALQRAREELEGRVEHALLHRNPYGLTFREFTILHLVAAGRADKEIARELGISPLTVNKHVSNILGKMDAASRTEAGVRAVREGLLD